MHWLHIIYAYILKYNRSIWHTPCMSFPKTSTFTAHHMCLHISKMKRKRHFLHKTSTFTTTPYMLTFLTCNMYLWHVCHFQNVFWHAFIVFISQGFINILKVISTTFSLLRTHICVTSRYVNLQVWIKSLYCHDMIYKLLLCFVSFYIVDGLLNHN